MGKMEDPTKGLNSSATLWLPLPRDYLYTPYSFVRALWREPQGCIVQRFPMAYENCKGGVGKRVSLGADLTASVQSLTKRARKELGVGHGRLFSSSGTVLDGDAQLGAAKLQTGDCLTLQVGTVRMCDRSNCFAAILGDGSVVTWGSAVFGGDSSSVQDQLKDVKQIQASFGAFAAVLGDGSVVTWGHAAYGGDSSSVQDQLKDVKQIQASFGAFAAVLGDGVCCHMGHTS